MESRFCMGEFGIPTKIKVKNKNRFLFLESCHTPPDYYLTAPIKIFGRWTSTFWEQCFISIFFCALCCYNTQYFQFLTQETAYFPNLTGQVYGYIVLCHDETATAGKDIFVELSCCLSCENVRLKSAAQCVRRNTFHVPTLFTAT